MLINLCTEINSSRLKVTYIFMYIERWVIAHWTALPLVFWDKIWLIKQSIDTHWKLGTWKVCHRHIHVPPKAINEVNSHSLLLASGSPKTGTSATAGSQSVGTVEDKPEKALKWGCVGCATPLGCCKCKSGPGVALPTYWNNYVGSEWHDYVGLVNINKWGSQTGERETWY